jgi:superfamily II DNA or RNA helicase
MFTPLDYQEECLTAISEARQQGEKKALVVMATALGKTVVGAFDVKKFISEQQKRGRILYLCHQNDILYQAKNTFQSILGTEYQYGYFHGQEKTAHGVDVLFASLQTMEDHKKSFSPDEFDYVIVDESHHAQAESYRPTIEYFTPRFLLGLTATPNRLDELDIREIFGSEVYSLPLEEAMALGYLTPVDYRLMTDEIQLSQVIETGDEKMSISRLNRSIFIPRRDEEIATIIAKHIADIENPRVIIFCASVQHCEHLSKIIVDSFSIHSRVSPKERTVKVEMFRQGLIDTVLVVDSFNEGIDIPSANVIVFLRSTSSATIFYQQLGRGLRRFLGKGKVTVLDFVANCERITMITTLQQSVNNIIDRQRNKSGETGEYETLTLNINSVEFQEKIIPILSILERLSAELYPAWQEASEAAKNVGIKTPHKYSREYKKDSRLPSNPRQYYKDFPGWSVFLGTNHYLTWEEASESAEKLALMTPQEYRDGYKKDSRLPSSPNKSFSNFPGWRVFLGKNALDHYPTWQEASIAAQALSIKNQTEYLSDYRKDPRLPGDPYKYEDFPGFNAFLGKDKYPTWSDAQKVCIKLGVKDRHDYFKACDSDPRLPKVPRAQYSDFPGWTKFLPKIGPVRYKTWELAGGAARKLDINGVDDYKEKYKKDPSLPSNPWVCYPDFPGFPKFLGKESS